MATFWKILNGFGIGDEASLKRFFIAVLSGFATLLINPFLVSKGLAPVSDSTILAFATIVTGFLVQSGLNSAAAKKLPPPGGGA